MNYRSLTSAEWLVLARFVRMGVELLFVKAGLVRGQHEWRDTLASGLGRALLPRRPRLRLVPPREP